MIRLPRLDDLAVEGRRVFVRTDLDVPLDADGRTVLDDDRIRGAIPTLRHLLDAGARVIVGGHAGQEETPASLDPAIECLAGHLAIDVCVPDEVVGDGVRKVVADLRPGALVALPNLLSEPGEGRRDGRFSAALAQLADIYVNDDLAASAHAWASTVTVPPLLAEHAAGLRLLGELEALEALDATSAGRVVILGAGGSPADLDLIGGWVDRLGEGDHLILGGDAGLRLLAASEGRAAGGELGSSEQRREGRRLLARAAARDIDLVLPLDLVAATSPDDEGSGVYPANADLPPNHRPLDMGPQTVIRAAALIATARTVFWHGAVGHLERPQFAAGTLHLARAVAETSARTWVHGRAALEALRLVGAVDRVDHRLRGDAASLAVLCGKPVPGLSTLASLNPSPRPQEA